MAKKTYIVLIRDHSGSMQSIRRPAARDYNSTVSAIQKAAVANNQDVIVSVLRCGGGVFREIVNSNVAVVPQMPENGYQADGNTPLFDSIMEGIDILKAVPDYDDPEVSFMLIPTTDGEEYGSRKYGAKDVTDAMKDLIKTDRWTFAFRVPRGGSRTLLGFGVPGGNILEWDQSERGMAVAAQANEEAFTNFMAGRAAGETKSTKFYANLADVSLTEVKTQLEDISGSAMFFPVSAAENEMAIRDFVESKLPDGAAMVKGGAFYQLVKTEPKVQDYKRIAIRSKTDGKVYAGDAARQMLALPTIGTVRLAPDELGDFEVFIQSTSTNRKVAAGTSLMYWKDVGVAFKEGKSAR